MRLEALRDILVRTLRALGAEGREGECVRLCSGKVDGCAGMIVDAFGPLVVATDYVSSSAERDAGPDAASLMSLLRELLPGRRLMVKRRAPGAAGATTFEVQSFVPEGAAATPLVAVEGGLRFEIGIDPAHDFGLYLDAAKARLHVRSIAAGKRVLNLFCYTAAFGIAAAVGGATEVTNVDPNRDYLAWALRNARLNDVNLRVLPDTAQDFLRKHLRRLERSHTASSTATGFDLVIIDPPAFGVGRGNERILRRLWPTLFESLLAMRPEHVLLMCNDKYLRARQDFPELVDAALGPHYRFTRLGTTLDSRERYAPNPDLLYHAVVEDPCYLEPVVLAGKRRAAVTERSGAA